MTLWKTAAFTPQYPGWIPPEDRTAAMKRAEKAIMESMPTVGEVFTGSATSSPDRPRIWQVVKAAHEKGLIPDEWMRNGNLKNLDQQIGSCVGAAAGNMALYATVVDAMLRGQRERITVPFWPYHYGRGRFHSGINGSGSGSFGSGQAKALATDGFLAFDTDNVPGLKITSVISYTSQVETQWSNGARIGEEFIAEGRKHLFPTAARVTSTEEAATLCDSYYVFTIASTWGGQMKCPVRDGVLLNSRSGTWNHQMSVLDYMNHPVHGLIFYVLNQWRYPHGVCPTGAPEGGFWIKESDLAWIISKRETFAFADPNGFVDRSRKFQWITAA